VEEAGFEPANSEEDRFTVLKEAIYHDLCRIIEIILDRKYNNLAFI